MRLIRTKYKKYHYKEKEIKATKEQEKNPLQALDKLNYMWRSNMNTYWAASS